MLWLSAGKPLNCVLHNIMKHTRNIFHLLIRKCKKAKENILKNKVLDSCINGNGDIFKEIRKLRKVKTNPATSMDGKVDNIADHFRSIYSELYNEDVSEDENEEVIEEIEARVSSSDAVEINKITPELVKLACTRLKNNKSDPQFSFSSDCIKNGPKNLFTMLSLIIKGFLSLPWLFLPVL